MMAASARSMTWSVPLFKGLRYPFSMAAEEACKVAFPAMPGREPPGRLQLDGSKNLKFGCSARNYDFEKRS